MFLCMHINVVYEHIFMCYVGIIFVKCWKLMLIDLVVLVLHFVKGRILFVFISIFFLRYVCLFKFQILPVSTL